MCGDCYVRRHHRQLPRLVNGPFRYKTFSADYLNKSKRFATKPLKAAVIAPSMLYLLYPLEGEIEGYTKEEFVKDLVDECEKDIRKCFESGAVRVSVDFTEGMFDILFRPSTSAEASSSQAVLLVRMILATHGPERRCSRPSSTLTTRFSTASPLRRGRTLASTPVPVETVTPSTAWMLTITSCE